MADSKIEIKVGSIVFSGEGDSDWLSKELDKVLAKIPQLVALAPETAAGGGNTGAAPGSRGGKPSGTLAAFLKAANVSESQPKKFLATAVWLHDSEDKNRLATTDVAGALSQHNQGKLSNPSDCLIKNTTKGYCVREGKAFYVTEEGRSSLK